MAYEPYRDLTDSNILPPQHRPSRWLEALLIVAFLISLIIGVAALGVWWTLRNAERPTINAEPLHAVRTTQIAPELAIRQLAGDPAEGLAAQAIQAGRLETARAILTYDTTLTPVAKAGLLTRLGRAYLDAAQPEIAAQVFRLVIPIAVLNPSIPSLERAQLLVQTAAGLAAAGNRTAALTAATQAQRIASQTPDLLPAQRSEVFDALRPLAAELADPTFQQQINDLARNPYLSPTGGLIPARLSTFAQQLPYDAPTAAAIAARQQAARILADRIATAGSANSDLEREALAQALRAEDQARTQFYATPNISLPQQTGLMLDKLEWAATKARIALKGYGVSIAPEWEAQQTELLAALAAQLRDIDSVFDANAAALPTPAEQAQQRVENTYWLAEQIERGIYADPPITDYIERLRILQDEAVRQVGPLALPLGYEPDAVPPGYRIQALGVQ
ncbi:MAG: hypothetical protein IPK16_31675 [Anaerolineales bacterium]|nr:hypothetical protein [Anaerolineales bacterium]